MWLVVRGLIGMYGRDILEEYLPAFLTCIVFTVCALFMTVVWAFGMFAQPGGMYILAGAIPPDAATHAPVPGVLPGIPDYVPGPIPAGFVTDRQRYDLAVAAGFSDPITTVAVSIAEDGSGNPAALSPPNFDGSRDLGLLQINSGWWASCGGHDALIIPINNFRCGLMIYGKQKWCAWSTYESSCGSGHNSSYRAFIPRAQAAAHP